MHSSRLVLLILSLTLALAFLVGCDINGKDHSSTGPTETTAYVWINAAPSTISPGAATTITVIAISNNSAGVRDRPVVVSTTRGILNPTTGTTNRDGKFITTLQTSSSDTATARVTATIDGVSGSVVVTIAG